jgi:hypothetical protein
MLARCTYVIPTGTCSESAEASRRLNNAAGGRWIWHTDRALSHRPGRANVALEPTARN